MSAVQEIPVHTKEIGATATASEERTVLPIPRLNAETLPYPVFLREFVETNRPVVIENATPDWQANRKWTPEYFRDHFGSQVVEVTYGVKMPLRQVIDAVLASTTAKPGPYLHKVIIHQDMPELLEDLSPENTYSFPQRYCSPLMPKRFYRPDGYLKLLIGGIGGKFPLIHFDSDNAHAMVTEIYGNKEFVLFPPEDTPSIYPHADSPSTSQIEDLDKVDPSRFPYFAKARQYRAELHPGESIFIPSRWWHSARVVDTSISVCTNIMHSTNWAGFIDVSCNSTNCGLWALNLAKRLYLKALGVSMSVVEGLQRHWPDSYLARHLGYLAPTTPTYRRFQYSSKYL